jgi:hypothetical protein
MGKNGMAGERNGNGMGTAGNWHENGMVCVNPPLDRTATGIGSTTSPSHVRALLNTVSAYCLQVCTVKMVEISCIDGLGKGTYTLEE